MESHAEDSHNKILPAALVLVAVVVAALLLQPRIREALAPELRTAWVGIEVEGTGVAEIGPVEIEAGTRFTLHAVLEGEDRQGRSVYYTLAPAIRFIGGPIVAADRLRRWNRPREVVIRWFTVEGVPPYVELSGTEDLEGWGFQELYRSDWPLAWSIPGDVDPARDHHLAGGGVDLVQRFGTLRYQVSFELYGLGEEILPGEWIRSWGAEEVQAQVERFPTVHLVLPGRLAPASKVFGLTQLVALSGSPPELGREVVDLAAKRLAYSRTTVIRDQIHAAGKRLEELVWTRADIVEETSRWGEDASPGDLVRVGDRMVVLYEDRGKPEVLDYDDLCFDYALGTAVRRLGDVFSGDGVVELASLAPRD